VGLLLLYNQTQTQAVGALVPATVAARSLGFTLAVTLAGTAVAGQTVRVDGDSRPTTYINPNTLTAVVLATDLLLPGSRVVTVVDAAGVDSGGGGTLTIAAHEAAIEPQSSWLPPPDAPALLLEDGAVLLLEDGERTLQEG